MNKIKQGNSEENDCVDEGGPVSGGNIQVETERPAGTEDAKHPRSETPKQQEGQVRKSETAGSLACSQAEGRERWLELPGWSKRKRRDSRGRGHGALQGGARTSVLFQNGKLLEGFKEGSADLTDFGPRPEDRGHVGVRAAEETG